MVGGKRSNDGGIFDGVLRNFIIENIGDKMECNMFLCRCCCCVVVVVVRLSVHDNVLAVHVGSHVVGWDNATHILLDVKKDRLVKKQVYRPEG